MASCPAAPMPTPSASRKCGDCARAHSGRVEGWPSEATSIRAGAGSSSLVCRAVDGRILATVAEQHGMDLDDVLEAAGYHFNTSFIQKMVS